MVCAYEFDNGISILSSLPSSKEWHICISEKSDLWTQPFNQLKKALDEAKELVPHADELLDIYCVLMPGWEKSFCVKHHTVRQIEEVLSSISFHLRT